MEAKLLLKYVLINLKAVSEYRADFLFKNVMMLLNNSIFYSVFIFMASRFDGISFLSYTDIICGLAIGHLSYAIGLNFYRGIIDVQDWIINGELDTLLIRPVGIYWHILVKKINESAISECIWAIILLFLVPMDRWLFVISFSLLGAIIIHFAVFIWSLIPFFVDTNRELKSFEMIISFQLYPPVIFDNLLRFMALYIFPGGMLSFGPVIASHYPGFFIPYFSMVILLPILFFILLKLGLYRYRSAGY